MTWFYIVYLIRIVKSFIQSTCGNVPTNMSVEVQKVIQERYVIPMVCSRCKHFWGYIGKNNYVVTCPHCRTKLSIKKNSRVPMTGQTPGEVAGPVIGTKQAIQRSDPMNG
jgi:DNA-directed RNA polymerase subunit RPC12/RpoP